MIASLFSGDRRLYIFAVRLSLHSQAARNRPFYDALTSLNAAEGFVFLL